MTVTLDGVFLFNGDEAALAISALAIEGTDATSEFKQTGESGCIGFNQSSGVTGRYGARVDLLATEDFSTHRFIAFQQFATSYGYGSRLDTVANGGLRITFVDSSGNYAGYNFGGSDIPGASESDGNIGSLSVYVGKSRDTSPNYFIDTSATPAIASGTTIDWTDVVAFELTANIATSYGVSIGIGSLCKHNGVVVTGSGETLHTVSEATEVWSTSTIQKFRHLFQQLPLYMRYQAGTPYWTSFGLTIGDGTTPTDFQDSNAYIGFITTWDQYPTSHSIGPVVQLDSANTRPFKINQSATCNFYLSDGSMSAVRHWQWVLMGSSSGVCLIERFTFPHFDSFDCLHGTYTDCIWDGGYGAVDITAATAIVRGTVRNGVGHGIKISGAAGDYSAIDVTLSDNSTYDIELGTGGAGSYDLSGISVNGAYTVKIRNDSATNAVTVALPAGISNSTSTAGGEITVTTPPVTVTVTVKDAVTGTAVENARVLLELVSDGTDVLTGLTNSSGVVTTSYAYTADVAVIGTARRATAAYGALYKPGTISGTVTASGFDVTVLLNSDE